MSDQMVYWLLSQAITAAGVYAAIRADLRELMIRMTHVEQRLDKA